MRKFEEGLLKLLNNKQSAIPVSYMNSTFDDVYVIDYATNLSGLGLFPNQIYIPDYSEYTTYYANQAVYYNSTVYIAIRTTLGNLPTDTNYWREQEDS